TPEHLQQDLIACLERIAGEHGIQLTSPSLMSKFTELILTLSKQHGQMVAVLIDEYDKPIIDHLGRGPQELAIAKANRDALKRFFGVLKDITVAPKLRFVFLTGISRFSKVSIFSELNNLDDISMSEVYAGLLGYTSEELLTSFATYLDRFAQQLEWTREQLIAKLAEQYNGYRFSKRELHVYNPCSILKSLHNIDFEPYWFETATPTFLINLLRQEQYEFPEIEAINVSRSIFSTFDLDDLVPEALLFQTGYVTIRDIQHNVYTLGYPNQEVKAAFSESLLWSLTARAKRRISSHVLRLCGYLRDKDFDAFFETMTAIFASIPYDIEPKRDEAYFHTLFYLMMAASGADARSSVLTCKGRIDLAVFFPDTLYIIEFKCNQNAKTAIQQIRKKGYADQYQRDGQQIVTIGINFSTEQKNLAEWKVVESE
ncbi:MAG: AAA family ATPase, partial [bacterium]|nr:AAA family ATPase [bacterium]